MKRLAFLENLDFRQHFREWHRVVLPIFVVVAAILLVIFLIARMGDRSPADYLLEHSPARIGLLAPVEGALFDPAFAVASPIEMVLAPSTDSFDSPAGSRHGALTYNAQPFLTDQHLGDDLNGIGGWNSDLGDPVYAAADGLVLYAGWPSDGWGNVVVLLHELDGANLVETFYGHLDTMTVPVGSQVRRGDRIGTIGTANGRYLAHLHFEIRRYPTLDPGVGYSGSELGRLPGELSLRKWRGRPDDSLARPPGGEPPESRSLQLDFDEGNPSTPEPEGDTDP